MKAEAGGWLRRERGRCVRGSGPRSGAGLHPSAEFERP